MQKQLSDKSDIWPESKPGRSKSYDEAARNLQERIDTLKAEKELRALELQVQALEAELHDNLASEQGQGEPQGNQAYLPAQPEVVFATEANRSFFMADIDIRDYKFKVDGASMEAAIFSLATQPDMSVWEWQSHDGTKSVKVHPSFYGRATMHDKDILIYAISQLVAAINHGRVDIDIKIRTIRFRARDFLTSTNKDTGKKTYDSLKLSLQRLQGTSILINDIKKNGQSKISKGFGLIDSWGIVEKSPDSKRMVALEITLSEWLFKSIKNMAVLTINKDYFKIRSPLERRLYEIARKHCGRQEKWQISLPLLVEKVGSRGSFYEASLSIRKIATAASLLDYEMRIVEAQKLAETFIEFSPKKKSLESIEEDNDEVGT